MDPATPSLSSLAATGRERSASAGVRTPTSAVDSPSQTKKRAVGTHEQPNRWGAALFVWAVWLVMLVSDCVLVVRYGHSVPHLDDWEIVPVLTGSEPLTWSWLWSQHNEHRVPLPRLILLALDWMSNFDLRAAMLFNVAILGCLAAGMLWTAATLRGRTSVADAFFPLVLLHWGHCDNLLWSWQVGFVLSSVLGGLLLIVIAWTGRKMQRWQVVCGSICLAAAPLCGANSLVLVPAIGLWFLLTGLASWRWGKPAPRRDGAVLLGAALGTWLVTGLYFIGYKRPAMPDVPPLRDCAQTSLEFMGVAFGPLETLDLGFLGLRGYAIHLGVIGFVWSGVVAVLLVWSAILVVRGLRRPGEWYRAIGLGLFLAAMLCLAAALGYGRAGFGSGMGMSRRYVTLAAGIICAIYLVLVLYGGYRTGPWVQYLMFGLAAAMLIPSTQVGYVHASSLGIKLGTFDTELKAGYPPIVLAEHFTRYPFALSTRNQKEQLAADLRMLHRGGWGQYRSMTEDPVWRPVEVSEQNTAQPEHGLYELKRPRYVYAIRVHYTFDVRNVLASFSLSWQSGDARKALERIRTRNFELLPEHDEFVIVYIDEVVSRFLIAMPENVYHITKVELLVP